MERAWQAPSLAMLIVKFKDAKDGRPFDICSSSFGALLHESICGFGSGRLPGDLGDTPGALDTGKGAESQHFWLYTIFGAGRGSW